MTARKQARVSPKQNILTSRIDQEYAKAERFLLSREFFGMKLGLENIRTFLAEIGSPQDAYKTIHVSGTNGKGSTCAMLDASLRAAGYKTGLYTSPHLVTFRERIQVNRRMVPKATVIEFVRQYRKEITRRGLTFFEVMTALAFIHFKQTKVDIAVIEVGLGGRLDATNVLTPLLTICTDISFDHVDILGKTLSKIAGEKAGIVKHSVPHLIGPLPEAAEKIMRKRSAQVSTKLYALEKREYAPKPERDRLDLHMRGLALQQLYPGLIGVHQLRNAAVAAKALSLLPHLGVRIPASAIRDGIAAAKWPGRFQIITHRGKPTFLCDVAHNPGGVEVFTQSFERRFPGRKIPLVVGFVKGKDHKKMYRSLSRIASRFSLVKMKTHRTLIPAEVISEINWCGLPVRGYASLDSALKPLLKTAQPDDIIGVVGSHYLVGEFVEKYDSR